MSSAPGARERLGGGGGKCDMTETIQGALTKLRDILHWAPDNLVGAVILLLAAIVALVAHSAVGRLLHRLVDARQLIRSLLRAITSEAVRSSGRPHYFWAMLTAPARRP